MSKKRTTTTRAAAVLLVLCSGLFVMRLTSRETHAQGGGYDLSWWTVDGGGLISSQGRGYVLGGTAGQPDAGASMSGGDYTLAGGFWGVGSAGGSGGDVYLPIVVK